MSEIEDIVKRVYDAHGPERARIALSDDVLDVAAALPELERVRLKNELHSIGVKTREWWGLVQKRIAAKKQIRVVSGASQAKPSIVVKGGELAKLTARAIDELGARDDVFKQNGRFVTAIEASGDKPPIIASLATDTIRVLLADSASWMTFMDDGPAYIDPPPNVVNGAAACPWKEGVRELDHIIEAPTIRPDGSLVVVPGYDESMRLLYWPNSAFPAIPEHPTKEDAMDALTALREVWENFPCESEADRSILIAAVITMVCRAAIAGPVPAFAVSANIKGSGKTKALSMACLIATGRDGATKAWPAEEAELEKLLDTAAIEGASYVFLDDLDAPFGGAALRTYLTSTVVQPRDFGRKRSMVCPWRGVILTTGNNLQLGRDIDRRTVVCRMLSDDEKPYVMTDEQAAKRFAHYPLEPWVAANRPRLVCAALTLVRAWILAGRPRGSQPALGSFEAWSRLVPDCIEWAGGANPLERAIESAGENENEEDKAFAAVLRGVQRLDPQCSGLKAKSILGLLYPGGAPPKAGEGPPDGFDDLRDAIESVVKRKSSKGVPDGSGLSYWLRSRRNQRKSGLALECRKDRDDIAYWYVRDVKAKA